MGTVRAARAATAWSTASGPRYTTPSRSQTTAAYRSTRWGPLAGIATGLPSARRAGVVLVLLTVQQVGEDHAVQLREPLRGVGLQLVVGVGRAGEPVTGVVLAPERQ